MVVGVLCISLGLQWAVLQGVAWTGMLISYARDGSLIEAVSKTFDGEHPCPLCKAVENGQKQDQEKSANTPIKKLDAVLVEVFHIVAPVPQVMIFARLNQQGERRADAPLRMPPRTGAA
ncbi:hypothetical protein EI77_02410 [Prosthecobacter fusiformis]|uniref:Uncharacterized protein n=2 Tax=Prosthecobacter fusiformis TaxID=48464 RepID=A0A4R7S2Q2_9BACT|nr:hypothetical protein EI77_02410 [Prosthecobacter fusiformis]